MTDESEVPLAPDSPELADGAVRWRSAYVHIPFCRRRCPYCDFAVVTPEEQPSGTSIGGYMDAVIAEIAMEPPWHELDAVNLGGGTPSTLDTDTIAAVVQALRERFGLAAGAEVSLEANPEDITAETVAGLHGAGINRISLGVQSFDDVVLRSLGRGHNAATAAAAVDHCRLGGIASVSIDLIFGTPGESLEAWRRTVRRALALDPDHLSAYGLTVERGTALSRAIGAGAPGPDADLQADMYEATVDLVRATELVHYEISNFARPGHPCRYNLSTWAQGEYVAFGLGAHGHRGGMRRRNVRRLDRYLGAVSDGERPEAGAEHISGWNAELERIMLGLRRRAGVSAGSGGTALLASEDGSRLVAAGVLREEGERLLVDRTLLTDEVNRAVLGLTEPAS
jgi:putative oxygen-independent coproporphyrinogen III oxidase